MGSCHGYIYIYLKNHSLCLFPYLGVSSWKSKIRWYIPKSSRNWALVEIWQFDKKSQALPNQHGSSVAHPVAVGGQATFLGYLYGPLCLPVRPECGVPGECVVCAGILFHQVLVLGAKLLPRPASRQLGWDSPSDLWGKWFVFLIHNSDGRVWLNLSLTQLLSKGDPFVAMVVVAGSSDGTGPDSPDKCPIIQEWLKLEAVVERATKGQIVLANSKLSRDTVSENYELLGPLVSELGILAFKHVGNSMALSKSVKFPNPWWNLLSPQVCGHLWQCYEMWWGDSFFTAGLVGNPCPRVSYKQKETLNFVPAIMQPKSFNIIIPPIALTQVQRSTRKRGFSGTWSPYLLVQQNGPMFPAVRSSKSFSSELAFHYQWRRWDLPWKDPYIPLIHVYYVIYFRF